MMRTQLDVWNPFNTLSDFDHLFGTALAPLRSNGKSAAFFSPATDVEETENSYLFHVDLPGLKKEDIKIEFKEGVLSITGERKTESESKAEKRHFVERSYGRFERVYSLGNLVDADRIEAEYREGVLKVTVPKAEAVKPKLISIKDSALN